VFYVIIAIRIVLVFGMAIPKLFPPVIGKHVILNIIPIDSNDFFHGEYVNLHYGISSMTSDVERCKDDRVCLFLERTEADTWAMTRFVEESNRSITSNPNTVMITGTVARVDEERIDEFGPFDLTGIEPWERNNMNIISSYGTLGSRRRYVLPLLKPGKIVCIMLTVSERINENWKLWKEIIVTDLFEIDDSSRLINSVILFARVIS
jgi:hypothetical protein